MSGRPQLVALPGFADRRDDAQFCGHCGRAAAIDIAAPASRVCGRCEMGLLIGAPHELAPAPSDPFVLVDSTLSVCGMSALAEELLGVVETEAVNRHNNELLVPAARGDGEVHDVVLRPTDEYGIRYWARIGPCGPPRAALMVLGDGSTIRKPSV